MAILVKLGTPYIPWPLRSGGDYEFGQRDGRISAELRRELEGWSARYAGAYNEDGWASEDVHRRRDEEGLVLRARVQRELGAAYDVQLQDQLARL